MNKWLWLDMDGTFADLYGQKNWLADIQARSVAPYENAECIYDEIELINLLYDIKCKGYKIGIISWCAKANDPIYDEKIRTAKKKWLARKWFDMVIDEVLITPYGQNKADTCRPYGFGVLADDEKPNRSSWDLGETIDANKDLIKELKKLLDN